MKPIIPMIAIIAVTSLLLIPVVTVYASTSLPMTGSQWAILELSGSKLTTSHADTIPADGGVEFLLPDAAGTPAGYVNLLANGFTASLTTSDTLTATIQIVTSLATTMFVGNPDGGCPALGGTNCPGTVRLYFASNLPQAGMSSCLGNNGNSNHPIVANEFDYWWSHGVQATFLNPGGYYQFSPTGGGSNGVITLQVSLDPLNWSDLCGTPGNLAAASFIASLANIKDVGLSFGSGFFFENGVGVDGTTGSATFQLTTYTIS